MKIQTMALLLTSALISPMAASAQSVSGHVTLRTDYDGSPLPANGSKTLSFHAKTLADGTVTGHVQMKDRSGGINTHGEVVCMVVQGNQAWLLGVLTKSDYAPADLEGSTFIIGLEDNGEGKNAAPDRRTGFAVTVPEALDYYRADASKNDGRKNLPCTFEQCV